LIFVLYFYLRNYTPSPVKVFIENNFF